MKVGQGAGVCLWDMQHHPRDVIRERWLAGDYGRDGERPRGEFVDGWLKEQGK